MCKNKTKTFHVFAVPIVRQLPSKVLPGGNWLPLHQQPSHSQPGVGLVGNITDKQRIAHNPSVYRGQVHPDSAISPVFSPKKYGHLICFTDIAHFSDQVHIWWGSR